MYFSRITLKPDADLAQFAAQLRANPYKEHKAIWRLFDTDPNAQRDFIYHYKKESAKINYYVLSKRIPHDGDHFWDIQTQDYAPQLKVGQSLHFMLHANATICKDRKRHDLVMYEKIRTNYKNTPSSQRPLEQDIVQQQGSLWLERQGLKSGFNVLINSLKVDGYQQYKARKSGGEISIKYSSLDFEGIIQVNDVQQFTQMLYHGLGRSKAFGCGLMLIRRV